MCHMQWFWFFEIWGKNLPGMRRQRIHCHFTRGGQTVKDNKNSFVLYKDQEEIFQAVTNEQAGKLIKAVFQYSRGEAPKLDATLSLVFISIKQTLKRDAAKWNETCKKRRDAGSLGGKARVANQANATFAKQNQANQADSVSVSVNDSVPVSDIKKSFSLNDSMNDDDAMWADVAKIEKALGDAS